MKKNLYHVSWKGGGFQTIVATSKNEAMKKTRKVGFEILRITKI